jgi:uncharacterized membrane protein
MTLIPLAILFVVWDAPWLWLTSDWSGRMFKAVQGGMPLKVRLEGALPVYFALAYLVQLTRSLQEAFLMGLAVYTVYEFTNYCALTKYELPFAVADSVWGGVLFVLVRSTAVYLNIL